MATRVVVYGSRPDGHARVVIEELLATPEFEVVGLIDDFPDNAGRHIGSVTIVGSQTDLERLRDGGVQGVVLGFGAADGRADVVTSVYDAGLTLPTLTHPTAHVALSARLAPGVQVLARTIIGPGVQLGCGVLVNSGAIVEHDGVVGDCAVIDPGAVLAGRVRIGEGAEVGAGAVVLPDVEIGARAVVGAGAVVTRSVLDDETVVGVPARPLRCRTG